MKCLGLWPSAQRFTTSMVAGAAATFNWERTPHRLKDESTRPRISQDEPAPLRNAEGKQCVRFRLLLSDYAASDAPTHAHERQPKANAERVQCYTRKLSFDGLRPILADTGALCLESWTRRYASKRPRAVHTCRHAFVPTRLQSAIRARCAAGAMGSGG